MAGADQPDPTTDDPTRLAALTAWGGQLLHDYGLGILFAANVFGAGSVYILSNTGANYGYALLWVFPLMLAVDVVMHDMSARLATIDQPLMGYLRVHVFGRWSGPFAISVALVMQLWSVANYAVAGFALAWFLPLDPYVGILAAATVGVLLVELKLYHRVEGTITGCIGAVFASYLLLVAGLDLSLASVAAGFVPRARPDIGYLTMVIALLGTTVYYPNFFIQSSIYPEKEWDSLTRYRKDNVVGVGSTVLLSVAVVVVSAATLAPGEMGLTTPGEPLIPLLGAWAMPAFVGAVLLASFTSGTGTLFGAGYMVPQAFGHDTTFGDTYFRATVAGLITVSAVGALLTLTHTQMTPIRLGITMPALNGVVGLPITVVGLWAAVAHHFDLDRAENLVFGVVTLILLVGAGLTAHSLLTTIAGYL